jgi:hypothetical protein
VTTEEGEASQGLVMPGDSVELVSETTLEITKNCVDIVPTPELYSYGLVSAPVRLTPGYWGPIRFRFTAATETDLSTAEFADLIRLQVTRVGVYHAT